MIAGIYPLLRPLLLSIDAETAHGLTIAALRALPTRPALPTGDPMLRQKLFGLDFPNPVGLAAGFDKNAEVPDAMLGFGFGFVEIGTVTPRPQAGNPRPRLFRLPGDSGVINRFGFNSQGHEKAATRLRARAGRPGIVGVNVGANKDAADRVADYVAGIRIFADLAGFFIVNVSSPNTPGLRDLQARGALDELLARVLEARDAAPVRRPVLLKIAPDLALAELDDVIDVARTRGIDGLIVSNTTISRPASLREAMIAKEAGGLSGRPLFELSTRMLAETYRRVDGAFPLVGTGGIDSPETALAKIKAGASLVQLYSALVYEGPGLAARIVEGLAAAARASGGIPALVGQDAATLAPG